MIDKEVYFGTVAFDIQAKTSGSAASNIGFSSPRALMILAMLLHRCVVWPANFCYAARTRLRWALIDSQEVKGPI
ncbi:MAG: hypothetical protein WB696_16295 [Chthoniobacterales bacterium]